MYDNMIRVSAFLFVTVMVTSCLPVYKLRDI